MKCAKCDVDFVKTSKGRHPYCDPCRRVYDNTYHANRSKESRQRKYALQQKRLLENRRLLYTFFLTHPCEHCGESDPVVLELDHKDRTKKDFVISNTMTKSWANLFKEIKKCRVLCANCHRRVTAKQFGWYSWLTNSGG